MPLFLDASDRLRENVSSYDSSIVGRTGGLKEEDRFTIRSQGRIAPVVIGLRQPRKAHRFLKELGYTYQSADLRPAEQCPGNIGGRDEEDHDSLGGP